VNFLGLPDFGRMTKTFSATDGLVSRIPKDEKHRFTGKGIERMDSARKRYLGAITV
jgi:hypothetical protein